MITKYFSRRDWCLTAAVLVLIIIQVYLDLKIPGYMSDVTNALQREGGSDDVTSAGVRMLVCALLSLSCALATGALASLVAVDVAYTMRKRQFDNVQRFSKQDVDAFRAESLITRSTNDVNQILLAVSRGLPMVTKGPILAVWAILKISNTSMQWTIATAVAAGGLMVLTALMIFWVSPLFRKVQWLTDGINRSSRENLDGIRVIRAYNGEEHQSRKFDETNDRLLDNNVRAIARMSPIFPGMSVIQNLLTLSIYWIGASLIMNAADTETKMDLFTDSIVFTSYALMVMSAFLMMYGVLRMIPRAMVSYRRIDEVVCHVPSVPDNGDGGQCLESGTVEFRDVSFAYPGADGYAVEGVSFSVGKGETVAIIGETGSGKSTIVALAERFYDATSGEVLVDGRDVRLYGHEELRRKLGYVPQQAIIFSGSVRENVNYGDGSESKNDEDVRRALRIAQAEQFVDSLDEGLDAQISQHGRNLSGGQKQRVAIARAVCRSPEIYLLDDCFSALDYRTDRALRDTLRREEGDRSFLIIAQRIGTIMDADRIVVLDKGRQVGYGTHEELMRTCPVYREIAASQITEGNA